MRKTSYEKQAEDFYQKEYPQLFRYALYLVHDAETARELCQETFIRWFEQDDKESIQKPRAWLKKVLSRQAYSYFRYCQQKQGLKERLLTGYTETCATLDDDILRIEVEDVLAGMKVRDRMLVKMRMAGMSYAEIAEALDISTGSVGTLLARAMKRFREAYTGKEAGKQDEMPGRRTNLTVLGK